MERPGSPDESLEDVEMVRADNAEDTVEAGVDINARDLTEPRDNAVMSPLRGLHQRRPRMPGLVTEVDIHSRLGQEELQ